WVALVTIDTTVKNPTAAHDSRGSSPRARATTAATVKTRIDESTTSGTAGRNTVGTPAHPAADISPVNETPNEATATSTARASAHSAISGDSGRILCMVE